MSEKSMTNRKAIHARNDLKVYASSRSLDAVNYAIAVLENWKKPVWSVR